MKLSQLMFLTGQSEPMLLAGLNWLTAHGDIQFQIPKAGEISLKTPGVMDPLQMETSEKELTILLNETRAFRSYYLRAEIASLLQKS